ARYGSGHPRSATAVADPRDDRPSSGGRPALWQRCDYGQGSRDLCHSEQTRPLRLLSTYIRSLMWLIGVMRLIRGVHDPQINRIALINHAISARRDDFS